MKKSVQMWLLTVGVLGVAAVAAPSAWAVYNYAGSCGPIAANPSNSCNVYRFGNFLGSAGVTSDDTKYFAVTDDNSYTNAHNVRCRTLAFLSGGGSAPGTAWAYAGETKYNNMTSSISTISGYCQYEP